MRSSLQCRTAGSRGPAARGAARLVALVLGLLAVAPAPSQYDVDEQPLLASGISELDVTLQGRYVRQWRRADGTHVLMFNGDFVLTIGQRRLAADNAVVWLDTRRDEATARPYVDLTVYLSGSAEVRELAGAVTLDNVLVVRGLRTYGQVIKQQDAHAQENLEHTLLYQQAERDRASVQQSARKATSAAPDIARPAARTPLGAERPYRVVRYVLPNIEPATTPTGDRVFVATGGVYFSQAGGPDAAMLEIRAAHAVVFPTDRAAESLLGGPAEPPATQPAPPTDDELFPPPPEEGETPETRGPEGSAFGLGISGTAGQVRAIYLEGDVVMSLGSRFVRADRVYYDFEYERALILDAVFRAEVPGREVPLYVRADEMRQLSAREFSADHAQVSTSEFYQPHYHIGAERIYVRDVTTRDAQGRATSPVAGLYELRNSTFNVGGVPLLWWPKSQGRLEESETLIRGLGVGYSSDRGFEFESAWYLFNLLGVRPPEGYDASLRLDFYSDRGPGVGADADYRRDSHFGLARTYFIQDDGTDTLGPLRTAWENPSTNQRGRVLWRHRHYLPRDWELTFEVAYASDAFYLEEFEQAEWFEDKQQETLIHLKRARGVEGISFLANARTLNFTTQTEHLPDLAYRRIGDTFLDPLVLYHESRVGLVRYLPDDRHAFPERRFSNLGRTDYTTRVDGRQEAELPLKLGPVNVVPFASVRGSYWDSQPLNSGGLWRGLGVYGVRGATSFSRVYDNIRSELFDIDRIRHIIKPDFAAWWAHSNTRSELITPFDYGIETIDDFYGVTAGIRQAWQTKRGRDELRRTVDVVTFNLEVGFFGNTEGRDDISNGYANPLRPENSRTRNYLAGDLIYRLSDSTSVLYDFNLDLNDWAFDRHNIALAVERSPRLAYLVGTRYADDISMCLVGGGWNYRLNEKHITAARIWYDLGAGQLGQITLAYIRRLPRWYLGLEFEYDNIDEIYSVSVSVWPEGVPEWTLGSRSYTNLATTTGIRP